VPQPSLSERSDFRTLIDNLDGVAIWIASGPETFEYISDGFEDIWGIPAEEVKSDVSRLYETIHPEDRERVRSLVEQTDEGPIETTYESRVVRPDGTVRWTQNRQFPIQREDGGYDVVGISVDVTELKTREQELEVLNRIIRHDIRNDISIVLGWAELLESHVDDDGREQLQKISRSGEHIVELTEIARDYAEAIAGGRAVDVVPVSLRELLETELETRRDAFPEARFVVEGSIPDADVRANEMLGSVFKNILNNGVQHNDTDDPVVTVSCELDGDDAVVRIADNGPGIPEDEQELIFQRGKKGIKSGGEGLGLHLVQRLVDQYDGTVAIEDNEPRGSVFVVRIPRAD
jgi:PAS domain S-box-containing protein